MAFTAKEKADRYDALQVALALAKECYESLRDDCERRCETGNGITYAYSRGFANACCDFLEDLGRWIE